MPDLPDVFEKYFDDIELTVDKPVDDQNVPPNPFKFQSIIKKRGRPKLGRDGAPMNTKKPKKKKTVTDFIDNNLTVHKSVSIQKIKKRGRPPKTNSNTSKKYVNGPSKKKLNQNLSTSSIFPSETCYTCDFKLDIHTTEAGERVIKCTRCNKSEIHESCYRNCRTCGDLQLI